MNLEELLRTAVDDGVRSVPPGFADGAIRRARRQRRTTRIAVAGGVAACALAAAAVAVVDPADPRTDAPPAESPDPAPDVLVDDVTDFDAVRTGSVPSLPWYADGALHVEDTSTPFDVPFTELSLDRVDGGFVALVRDHQQGAVLYLVRDGAEPEQVHVGTLSDVVVSPDGRAFAWATPTSAGDGPARGMVTVTDARTGRDRFSSAEFDTSAHPVHFAGPDEVVVETELSGVLLYSTMRPGSTASWPGPVPSDGSQAAMSPDGRLVATVDGTTHVIWDRSAAEQTIWRLEPGQRDPRFSPDSRLLASVAADGISVQDALTGATFDSFPATDPGPPRWESAATVVFIARSDDGDAAAEAVVRCTVGEGCELATEPGPRGRIRLGD
ncbi:WD40 repeat domain-containing protein [Jiangella ureilytica]|uniref:WD40 repeat domain-containing protein n=1 Tax=Jiangella ureilytica TaxID=2530374 RepID=A0A4R4RKG3_9ACTN|nr:WD40 repeat domain-containing protein [Jiangella ureilytica]TDC49102.1 WD40 repeat domain-containing protein [Jiangella ureilytica]